MLNWQSPDDQLFVLLELHIYGSTPLNNRMNSLWRMMTKSPFQQRNNKRNRIDQVKNLILKWRNA